MSLTRKSSALNRPNSLISCMRHIITAITLNTQQASRSVTAQKPSKTAQKKAVKAARLEKKQQKAVAKGRTSPHQPQSGSSSPMTDEQSLPSIGTYDNPLELISAADTETQSLPPDEVHTVENGHTKRPESIQKKLEPTHAPVPSPNPLPTKESVVLPVEQPDLSLESEQKKKRQNALTRSLWAFIMIGGFISEFDLGMSANCHVKAVC
jgi:phosphatidate cytidylyltransferase